MEATLQALVALLIKSIPTIILFAFLTVYLRVTYFGPVARILKERREKTEGVKELAQKAFESADKKSSEYERALQIARGEINQQHEALRRQWAHEQSEALAKARAQAEAKVEAARASIAAEVERAESEMDSKIEELSTSIVDLLTRRRAA
jgi:F0F1-type ATP synthase membrane subunit b/b'